MVLAVAASHTRCVLDSSLMPHVAHAGRPAKATEVAAAAAAEWLDPEGVISRNLSPGEPFAAVFLQCTGLLALSLEETHNNAHVLDMLLALFAALHDFRS